MAINYGSIDPSQRTRKPRQKTLIDHSPEATSGEPINADDLEARLLQLSKQNRAPSVAKAAATELLERVKPKKIFQDPGITGAEAARVAEIYERLFGTGCPNCGHVLAKESADQSDRAKIGWVGN